MHKNTVLTSQRSERFLSQKVGEERCLSELPRKRNSFTLEDGQPCLRKNIPTAAGSQRKESYRGQMPVQKPESAFLFMPGKRFQLVFHLRFSLATEVSCLPCSPRPYSLRMFTLSIADVLPKQNSLFWSPKRVSGKQLLLISPKPTVLTNGQLGVINMSRMV